MELIKKGAEVVELTEEELILLGRLKKLSNKALLADIKEWLGERLLPLNGLSRIVDV